MLQILLGGLLLATDHEAPKGEHYMYGIVALLASFIGEGMRTGAAERELPENVDFETLEKPEQRDDRAADRAPRDRHHDDRRLVHRDLRVPRGADQRQAVLVAAAAP